MAMAQTVVPVYTIPNTYWVQQSLWESLCQIIPGIARTSESELCSCEPTAPRNVPVGQSNMALGAGSSHGPRTGTVGLGNPKNVAVSLSTCEKDAMQGIRPASLPDRIPPVGSEWALFPQHVPTVNLANDGILLMPIHQKPALPSRLPRNLGNTIPKRNLTFPK